MDATLEDASKLAYPEEEECAVCLESKQWLRDLPCHHCVCETCLLHLIENGEKSRSFHCPFCRAPYSTDSSQLSCFGKQILLGKIRCENCNHFAPTRETMWCDRCGVTICTMCGLSLHKQHELFEWESSHVIDRIIGYVRNHDAYQLQNLQMEKDRIRADIHRMLDSVLDEITTYKWEQFNAAAGTRHAESVVLVNFLNRVFGQKIQAPHLLPYYNSKSLHLGLVRLLQLLDVDESFFEIADSMETTANFQHSCTPANLKNFLSDRINVNLKTDDKNISEIAASTSGRKPNIPGVPGRINGDFEATKSTLRNIINHIAGPGHWKIRSFTKQGHWYCHVTLYYPSYKEFLGESTNKLEAEANACLMALLFLQDEGILLEDFRLVSKFRDESRGLRVALGAQFDPIEAGDLRDALSGHIVNEIELPINFTAIKGIAKHEKMIGIIACTKIVFIDVETNSITASYELRDIADRRYRDYIHRFSNDSLKCITYSPKVQSFLALALITFDEDPWILFRFQTKNGSEVASKKKTDQEIGQFHLPVAKWRESKIVSNVLICGCDDFLLVCCVWEDNVSEIRQMDFDSNSNSFGLSAGTLIFQSNMVITQMAAAHCGAADECVCYVVQGFDEKLLKIVKNSGAICAIPHVLLSTNIHANSKLCVDHYRRPWIYDGVRRQIRCSGDGKTWISQTAREGIAGIVGDGYKLGVLAASINNLRLTLTKFDSPDAS